MENYLLDAGAWTEDQAARAKLGTNLTSSVGGAEMVSALEAGGSDNGTVIVSRMQ